MRFFSFAAIAVLSASVMGQGISDIPKCAQACFASSLGTCGATDFACICGNTAVIDKVSCCIFATCPQADIAATTQLASQLCKLANVQVNTAPVCAATSSAPAGLASPTPSMSPAGSGSATPSASATSSVGNGTASATTDSSSASASYAVSTGAASSQSTDNKFGLGVVVAGLLAVL